MVEPYIYKFYCSIARHFVDKHNINSTRQPQASSSVDVQSQIDGSTLAISRSIARYIVSTMLPHIVIFLVTLSTYI